MSRKTVNIQEDYQTDELEPEVSMSDVLLQMSPEGTTYDVTDAPNAFAPLPAGEYLATVTKSELTTSKTGGNPMINFTLTVDLPEEDAGRLIFDRLVFTPKAMGIVKSKCAGFGIKLPAVVGDNHIEKISELLLETQPVRVNVVIENSTQVNPATGQLYNPKNVVKSIKPLESVEE